MACVTVKQLVQKVFRIIAKKWHILLLVALLLAIFIIRIRQNLKYSNGLLNTLHASHLRDRTTITKNLQVQDYENSDMHYTNSPLNIIFLETSGSPNLKPRQACAIESAAKTNPNAIIRFMHTTTNLNLTDPYIALLFNSTKQIYSNIYGSYLNFSEMINETPLEMWYNSNETWRNSSFPEVHLSDVLRIVTLYKIGGIYLDLDIVVLKDLGVFKNFVALQDFEVLSNAVIGFEKGHPFLLECMKELNSTYQPRNWSFNGPNLVERVIRKYCNDIRNVSDITPDKCNGVLGVLPKEFYPIHWTEHKKLFQYGNPESTIQQINGSYLFHWWNSLTRSKPIKIGSRQAYEYFAKMYCPNVYVTVAPTGKL